ncbi:MAG: hypothetical protein A4E30_00402 [Methanomassiliicoccales archaeon PtaB.Bin215]|nr:MAG: hypothetical protein A4E30_00402 [Methanomassiliicoccales archaeon PtaB.Bin215]
MVGSTSKSMPITSERPRARSTPEARVTPDLFRSLLSPRVVARDIAMLGPSRGAMTMAPITTATLSLSRPMAATRTDRVMVIR